MYLQVLLQLQSTDAAVRGAAEELLNGSPVEQLLPTLAAAAATPDEDASSRQLAAVLLRRYTHNKLKELCISEQKKQQLIEAVLQTTMGTFTVGGPLLVQKAAAEAIAELWQHLPVSSELKDGPVV